MHPRETIYKFVFTWSAQSLVFARNQANKALLHLPFQDPVWGVVCVQLMPLSLWASGAPTFGGAERSNAKGCPFIRASN